ncbi:MAG: hypothetical protein JST61_03765 [Acidobacteria bacterium]|nr:hypothetical protein [Acidobacteriota bacterium]
MISQCEAAQKVGWLEDRAVVPLEFHELSAAEEVVEVAPWIDHEQHWKAQIASLEENLIEEKENGRILAEQRCREAEARVRDEMSVETEKRIGIERATIVDALREFSRERERYFDEVEAEVVGLALAIARRVLHREASLDPLLLQAAVRVALGKVAGESNITLRVAETRGQRWRDTLAAEQGEKTVTVVEDHDLDEEELVIATEVGRVELGVGAQLKEIERGFFDLLKKRPTQ